MSRATLDLEAAKRDYFSRGGVITAVEGYSYKPHPERRETPFNSSGASVVARVLRLVEAGMTIRRIASRTGVSQASIQRMLRESR